MLKDQLNAEIKKRQLYILRTAKAGEEIREIRQSLDESLRTVSRDPTLDALLLEQEARKLDSSLGQHLSRSQSYLASQITPSKLSAASHARSPSLNRSLTRTPVGGSFRHGQQQQMQQPPSQDQMDANSSGMPEISHKRTLTFS